MVIAIKSGSGGKTEVSYHDQVIRKSATGMIGRS
jgi:hypothetical protein